FDCPRQRHPAGGSCAVAISVKEASFRGYNDCKRLLVSDTGLFASSRGAGVEFYRLAAVRYDCAPKKDMEPMDLITGFFGLIEDLTWGWALIPILVIFGSFITLMSGFVQIEYFTRMFRVLASKN